MSKVTKESSLSTSFFNLGFNDAYEDLGCNLPFYEGNEAYRRGYDAGEDMIEEDGYEPLTEEEQRELYGDAKDRV